MNRTQWSAVAVILAIVAGVIVLWIGPSAQNGDSLAPPPAEPEIAAASNESRPETAESAIGVSPVETADATPAPDGASGKGRIRGTVRMPDGSPVPADIAVTLLTYDADSAATDPVPAEVERTDISADAAFDFPGLPFGSYVVYAGNDDYTQHGTPTLNAERREWAGELTLYPGGAITGHVIDDSGQPIPGSRVFVAAYHIGGSVGDADRERALGSQVETAEDGHFIMRHLRRSTDNDSGYKLAVIAEGFAPYSSDYVHAGTDEVEFVLSAGGAAQGQLVHYETLEPLPGKSLRFASGLAVGDRIVETDPEGWFFAPALAAGDHNVELVDDDLVLMPETENVVIVPGREASDLLLLAATGGVVTGHVRDSESGRSIPNAEVHLSGQRTRTDARGGYRFAGLKGGEYHISVGEVTGYARNSDRNSPNRRLTVSPGVEFDGVDFELYRGLRVSGVVVDEAGVPVHEAHISASTFGSNEHVYNSATSNAQGRFSLAGFLPNSSIRIQAYKNELFASGEHLRLDLEDTDLNGITVELAVSAWVAGHVFDQRGKPVERMDLVARVPGHFEQISIGRTRTDGSFVIPRLLPGTYEIHPQNNGPGATDALHTFTIAKGEKLEGLRLVYEVGSLSISGTVTDSNNQPIHPAAVVELSNMQHRALTDEDGHFTLTGLDDREYTLIAFDKDNSMSDSRMVGAGEQNAHFVISDRATIEGYVIDAANGQPVTNFEIYEVSDQSRNAGYDPRRFRAASHPEGRFVLEKVTRGSRKVLVKADGYALASVDVPNLQPGETRADVVVRLIPGARIEGRVVDARGNPIAGSRIFLGNLPNHWRNDQDHHATTESDGTFELRDLSAGTHQVSAVHDRYLPATVNVTASVGSESQALLKLTTGGIVSGRVTVAGRPANNAEISGYIVVDREFHRFSTRSNAAGEYALHGLPEGEAKIGFSLAQRQRSATSLVEIGGDTRVDMDFPAATARLFGTIVGSDNRPLPNTVIVRAAITAADGQTENQGQQAAPDGTYDFSEILAGKIVLTVHYNDTNHESGIQLRDGQSLRHNIVIDEGATIELRVGGVDDDTHDATAFAVPDAVDMSRFEDDFIMAFLDLQSQSAKQERIRNGKATFTGIKPGDYTIIILRADKSDTGDFMAQIATARFVSTYVALETNGTYPITLNF